MQSKLKRAVFQSTPPRTGETFNIDGAVFEVVERKRQAGKWVVKVKRVRK